MSGKTVKEILDKFCEIGPRPPASEGEKEAADYLTQRFETMGCEVKQRRFLVRPAYYYVYALHFFFFLIAMSFSTTRPGDGFIIGIVIIISYLGDLSARHHFLRDIFPRLPSLNVVARKPVKEAQKRIVLVAHIDSGRSGHIYNPSFADEVSRFFKKVLGRNLAPYYYLFLVMVVAEVIMFLNWLFHFWYLPIIFGFALFICSIFLIAGIVAMFDIAIAGRYVTGANGNASGVAAMVDAFESLTENPPEGCEIWAVATGSKMSGMTGMKDFAAKYFDELDQATTFFINFDHVGAGKLRNVVSEGWVRVVPYPYEMNFMVDEIKRSDPRFAGIEPYSIRSGTDGIVPARAGYKTITLTCLNENDYPPNYLWKTDIRENVNDDTVQLTADFAKILAQKIAES